MKKLSTIHGHSLFASALAAAALLAACRAFISISATGYLEQNAWNLIWIGGSARFIQTFAVALPIALLARYSAARTANRPVPSLVGSAICLALFALIIGLPWPLDSASNLGTFDETGRRATLSALLGACLATTLISTVIPRAIALPIAIVGVLVVLGSTSVSFPPERASWPERPNIILVSIDTQRPDHLSCYGYERVTSPNIDRFAQEAVRFDQVFTPYPWTLVSHMSLFTSLNPTAHGVSPTRALPAGIPTLATHLQQSGYRTVALLDSVKWLAPEFEFDRGFDVYSQVSGGAAEKRRRIAPVLDDLGSRPFFLFLHFFDVHSDGHQLPYESADEDYQRFAGDYRGSFTGCEEGLGCASRYLAALSEERRVLDSQDLKYLIALYDAGIRTFDREFGLLLEDLEARGLYENSVIALTADHGEAFFEHGVALHGGINDEVVRIPLLIKTPSTRSANLESQLLSMIDIAPTLLDYCGISAGSMQGSSFRDLVESDVPAPERRTEWVLLEDGRERWHGIRTERWKAIRYENNYWKLFDLETDPEEKHNLLRNQATPPPEFAALIERYETERARMVEFQNSHYGDATLQATDAERAELEALGYLGEFDE